MAWSGLLASVTLVTGCTFGAATRVEGTLDPDGHAHLAADAEGSVGFTRFDDDNAVATRRAIVGLFFVGLGWSEDRPVVTVGWDLLGVPSPDQRLGVAGGVHITLGEHSFGVKFGLGAVGLLAQTRAADNPDAFGPNPKVTRFYQSLEAVGGFLIRDGRDEDSARFGLAYTAGVSALIFAPGP